MDVVPTRDIRTRTKTGRRLWITIGTITLPRERRESAVLVHVFRDASRQILLEGELKRLVRNWLPQSSAGDDDGDAAAILPGSLTDREREVLGQLASGTSNREIAEELCISPSTVKNHVHNILEKLGANNRLQAVSLGRRNGLI